jgi:peptidoglycan/xylan/chitin deacetylase (PgdA/CDA1 family)
MAAVKRAPLIVVALVGCASDTRLQYSWDERRVLCSLRVDQVGDHLSDDAAEQLAIARADDSVALLHAHEPGHTVSTAHLAAIFARVADEGLAYVTYPELVPSATRRAAVALAFDDNAIASWHAMRPLLASHGARVTFFVSRFSTRDPRELAQLADLAADGHAVQGHGVDHLDPRRVVAERGLDAYLDEEALPSIVGLRRAGYAVTSYAYPFGHSAPGTDTALLEHVERLRVSPGGCPY